MLWSVSRAARVPPSDLLNLDEWASNLIGMEDIWTPLQFNAAVSLFGNWIEGKLNQFDPKTGKALYELEDLLDDEVKKPVHFLEKLKGFAGVRVKLKGD